MRNNASKREYRSLSLFFLIALAIHALILLPLFSIFLQKEPLVSNSDAVAIKLLQSPKETSTPQKNDNNMNKDNIVVEMGPTNTPSTSTTETKYLSQHGSSATKETKQRGLGKRAPNVAPLSIEIKPTIQKNASAQASMQPPGPQDDIILPGPTAAAPPQPKAIELKPTVDALEKAVAGSGLSDLGDLLEGDKTLLNSASFRHAQFFNRVQKMVEQFWYPDIAMQINDPNAQIIGTKDRVTTLLVVLFPNGNIKHIYTQHPSGASFLDNAAIDAVTKAGPFPNVPKDLIHRQDGLVRFLFQFTLEINQKPAIRIRRYD